MISPPHPNAGEWECEVCGDIWDCPNCLAWHAQKKHTKVLEKESK